MTVLQIIGKRVDVDVEAEIRQYSWDRERWTPDKLIACSPFRSDSNPSFFVNLETGGWADSGGIGEYTNGNLLTLLGYLRGTSSYEAGEYLIDIYGALYDISEGTEGEVSLQIETPKLRSNTPSARQIDGENITQAVSPYIKSRGISDEVQRMFGIGYGEGHEGFTALPWHTADGRLANVKYRSTGEKRFFYESKATPVTTLVYGIDVARGSSRVVIVEAEIDAISWWTAGIPAIALGGAHINDRQAELIMREGFSEIYFGGDNDDQGRKLNRLLADKLKGTAQLYEIDYGEEKDANDVLLRQGVEGLCESITQATPKHSIRVSNKVEKDASGGRHVNRLQRL